MKTKFLNAFTAASAVFLTFLGAASARAGTITVVNLPATNTDIATGIDTNKHYVCAFDYGNSGATVAINGVPFTHFDPQNQTVNLTNVVDPNFGGQVILSSGPPAGNSAACKLARTSNAGQGNLAGQSDGNMVALLTDLLYVGSSAPVGTWLQQEYDNLTIGHPYSLRIYYRYWGNTVGARQQNVWFNGEGIWQAYSHNPIDEDSGGAHYIEYDFTASATNVFCRMTNIVANESMMIEGATLEDTSSTYPYAPFITYQPYASVVGNPSMFAVTVIGTVPLAYQWYYNTVSSYSGATAATNDGINYSGATTSTLTATNNLLDYYYVVVTNNYGSITSAITQLNPAPTIVQQPTAAKVGNSIVVTVTAGGLSRGYQWYVSPDSSYGDGTLITDGNGYSNSATASLTVTTNLLDYYFVVVTNYVGSVTSSIVLLAVPLTPVSAGEPIWNQAGQTNVIVTFSDMLDPVTSTSTGNYSLNNGASVLSAKLAAPNEVVLGTGTNVLNPATSYTLTVKNVKDSLGIVMSPSPTNIPVGIYPVNLALWVRADTGVTTDAGTNTVNQWIDLSGNSNNLVQGTGYGLEEPLLETNAWGDMVLHFDGTSPPNGTAMLANDAPSLELTNDISIIAVVNFTTPGFGGTNGEIISKTGVSHPNIAAPYDYYAADTGASLYRGNGTGSAGDAWFTADIGPAAGTPHIVAVIEAGNTVTHYVDGQAVATGTLLNNLVLGDTFGETNSADQGQPVVVGGRADLVNFLTGDLAELIVAGSALSTYDQAALNNNYLIPEHYLPNLSPTNVFFSVTANGSQLKLSWPGNRIGWELQSNSVGVAAAGSWFAVPGSTTTNQMIITLEPNLTNVYYRMVYPPQ